MKKCMKFILLTLSLSILLFGCTNNKSKVNSSDSNTVNSKINSESDNIINATKDIDKSNDKEKKNTKDTNSTSNNKNLNENNLNKNTNNLKKITIVIDPGHSSKSSNEKECVSPDSKEKKLKDTSGATGVSSGIPEYTITHKISIKLKNLLEKEGYNVILTKDNINEQRSNIERANIGNKANANLLIRIHCDGVDSPSAKGASILVPEVKGYITENIAKKSYSYGEKILNSYTKTTGIYNRGVVKRDDLTGFNWSKVPVVLLELGFISNPKEDSYLSNDKNYNQICEGIAQGINNCFK